MRKKKIIVGLLGTPNSGRTTAAKILKKKGFYRASINDKVEEFAKHLFNDEELSFGKNQILNKVRERGYSVSKEYWLNLILVSVPDDTNLIVFDDISMEEAHNSSITVYQIHRDGVSTDKADGFETIENNGVLKDFTQQVEELYKKIVSL